MATSLDHYGPFDTGAGANTMAETWRSFMRHVRDNGVIATKHAPDAPDELEVYADSTGMQVKVRPGQAWVRAVWGEITATTTLPIAAAPTAAGTDRIDLVVVRADLENETMELAVVEGTPSTTPEPPTPTTTANLWEIPLAQVFVEEDSTTVAAADVTDERKRVGTGIFNTWEPPLYYEGTFGSYGENDVGLGLGATKRCDWFLVGNIMFLRYWFDWGTNSTAPNNWYGGQSRIYTKLPPGFVAADTGDTRMPAHLWTTQVADMDWAGSALVASGSNRVWPFFPKDDVDCRLSWYRITDATGNAGTGVPLIDGSFPEGGHLTISGSVEVVNTGLSSAGDEGGGDPGGGGETTRYTTTYQADWSKTWDSGGSSTGFMYQGRYGSSSGGYERSKFGFDEAQIQSDLAGASIVKVELYLKNAHAYYSSGLSLMLGTHADDFMDHTSSTTGNWDRSDLDGVHFNKYEGKWITLPNSIGTEFQTGATSGFCLGDTDSGNLSSYGYFDGANNNYPPLLRLTYDK